MPANSIRIATEQAHQFIRVAANGVRRAGRVTADVTLETYHEWRDARTLRLGAGIAYYGLFAIVPLLMLGAAIVSIIVSQTDAKQFLSDVLVNVTDVDPDLLAANIVDNVDHIGSTLGIFGAIALLVSASFLFMALQDALNVIWNAPVRVGIKDTIRRRLLAFGVALLTALFFVSGFVIGAFVSTVERWFPGETFVVQSLARVITSTASWVTGIITLALLYRLLPYAKAAWRNVLIGAAITAGLVAVGTGLIGAYVSHYATSSISAAAGTVLAVLAWVYFEAQIILAGAVLTKVLQLRTQRRGDGPRTEVAT